jgi:ribosomal-protein-alanine N-acetyltransferase
VIVIKDAVVDDLASIHRIELDVYSTPWSISFFTSILLKNNGLFLVASEDCTLMGYCIGVVEIKEKRGAFLNIGHVLNIAVGREHQCKGVGSMLMDEIERIFSEKGIEIAYLEVKASNNVAQEMYTKRGYQYVKTESGYYGDEDGFIMMKPLTR